MSDFTRLDRAAVIRTDFTDDLVWKEVKTAILRPHPVDGFQARLELIDDPRFDRLSVQAALDLFPEGSHQPCLFLVDDETIENREHPVLVVDLLDERGRTFRVIPSEMWNVENNLTIANISFVEFAEGADDDGVFRGYPE